MSQSKTKNTLSKTRRTSRPGRLSSRPEKATASIRRNLPSASLPWRQLRLLAAAIILVVAIVVAADFYQRVYSNPKRVFEGMITNNLSTSSVTRTIAEPVCLNSTANAVNLVQINYLPTLQAHCITALQNATSHSKLTVESLGDKSGDYEHYLKIQNAGSDADKYDEVYKVWLKNRGTNAPQQLLIKSLFNPILFGDLTPTARQRIAGELKSSYSVKYDQVLTRYDGGRKMYRYDMLVKLPEFSKAWNDYISYYGFNKIYLIKPGTYTDSDKLSVSLYVDVISREVRAVNFQGNTETYSAYGISRPLEAPAQTYSAAQLQRTLNAVQK